MPQVKTQFKIKNKITGVTLTVVVDGSGQEAANKTIQYNKENKVILEGFIVDGKTIPVDLRSHWQRINDLYKGQILPLNKIPETIFNAKSK